MTLSQQCQPTVIENQGDRPYSPLQLIEPSVASIQAPEMSEQDQAISPSPTLTDTEFSPDRPGPAWMWEFGVMG